MTAAGSSAGNRRARQPRCSARGLGRDARARERLARAAAVARRTKRCSSAGRPARTSVVDPVRRTFALVKDDHAVRDALRLVEIVRCQEDRAVARAKRNDESAQHLRSRVERGRGLVEQQDRRIVHQGSRDMATFWRIARENVARLPSSTSSRQAASRAPRPSVGVRRRRIARRRTEVGRICMRSYNDG